MSLFAELRRRNVIRMAGLYLVLAWLLIQVAETLLPIFDTPGWVLRTLVVLVALGFIPALVFSWIYELTPEGLKRDAEVTPELSIAPQTAQRMDRLIFAGLLALVAVIVADRYWPGAHPSAIDDIAATASGDASLPQATRPQQAPANSIAVLPFVNMSPDPDQEYFSDGISEEILNVLSRTPGLHVAARTSAFSFKGSSREVPEIAEALNVRLVLEGSVRKQGQRVRITAQLIDAASGYHRWSETFDRELADIFMIQDEIAQAVAVQMKVQLEGASTPEAGSPDLLAYDFYLQGVSRWQARGEANLRQAEAFFRESLQHDPGFAKAWSGLGLVHAILPEWSTADQAASARVARDAGERALALDPDLPEAYTVLAYVALIELRLETSHALFERALDRGPSYASGVQWFGWALTVAGELERGEMMNRRAILLDPQSAVARAELAFNQFLSGKDEVWMAECASLQTDPFWLRVCSGWRTAAALAAGDGAEACAHLEHAAATHGDHAHPLASAMCAVARGAGNRDATADWLHAQPDGTLDFSSQTPLDGHAIISWLSAMGRPDLAVQRFSALAEHLPHYARASVNDARLAPLHCDAQFRNVAQSLHVHPERLQASCARATDAARGMHER
jgi:adenylate cyclase